MPNTRLITAPDMEPVSTSDAKAHLNVDFDDDDVLISAISQGARAHLEEKLGRALITQTWQLWLDRWPAGDTIRLPRPRLQSVSSITYYDTDDAVTTFATTNYDVDTIAEPGRVVLKYAKTWPQTTLRPSKAISIEYVAGYGDDGSDVPGDLISYLKLLIGTMYAHRETEVTGTITTKMKFADHLWTPHQVMF